MLNENISFADSIDRLKESFLWAAAQGGNSQDCAALLEIGADVNWKNVDGDTPLLAACRRGHTETIELLLSHGADSNMVGNDSYAPLHICARRGDVNSLDVLLNANTNTTIKTKNGQTALDIAKEKGHEAIYGRIMRVRPRINSNLSNSGNLTARSRDTGENSSTPLPTIRSELPAVNVQNRTNHSSTPTNNPSSRRRNSLSTDSARSGGSDPKENSLENGTTDRLLTNFGNSLNSRSERIGSNVGHSTLDIVDNGRDIPKKILKDELSSKHNHSNYSIIGQSNNAGFDDPSSVVALRRLLDAEKVSKSILEAKLEVFATQNKQLIEEFRSMSEELISSQDILTILKKKVALYEGKKEEVDQLTIDDCEEYEKTLKRTLTILEDRKGYLTRNLIESQKEQRLCVICQEKEKTVVLLPCRHMCLCDTCSSHDQLDSCPLCRKPVAHKISVFS